MLAGVNILIDDVVDSEILELRLVDIHRHTRYCEERLSCKRKGFLDRVCFFSVERRQFNAVLDCGTPCKVVSLEIKIIFPFGPYSMDDCLITRAKLDKHVSQLAHHWHMDYPMQLDANWTCYHCPITIYQHLSTIIKPFVNFYYIIVHWHLFTSSVLTMIQDSLPVGFLSSHEPAVIAKHD